MAKTLSQPLVWAALGLVVAQACLVVMLGFKPPQFKTGYYTLPGEISGEISGGISGGISGDSTSVSPPIASVQADYQRLLELEGILSPAPVLAWAEAASDYVIPEIIAPEIVLGFKGGDARPPPPPQSENIRPSAATPAATAAVTSGARLNITPPVGRHQLAIDAVYIETLPDLSGLGVAARKKQFIAFMLPLILRANVELEKRRGLIDAAFKAGRVDELHHWAELYAFDATALTAAQIHAELIIRVAPVPVSIALAQGAIESGWGTSRFAIQGNAIYGQWAWSADAGIKPQTASNERAVVRSFANLFDSVRAYMHNLNTHWAYADFRSTRHALVDAPLADRLQGLVAALDQYSEKREAYVTMLVRVMNDNRLWIYDEARLAGG